jgi:MraZ protein
VRYLFAHTEELSCDAQGRLMLPATLRAYAKIEKDVLSVGAHVRVEIWARERFAEQIADAGSRDIGTELGLF